MSDRTYVSGDLAMRLKQGVSFTFIDYEPRGIPGFQSNIAAVFGCSENQTDNLLREFDGLEGSHHYEVDEPKLLQPKAEGPDYKYPAKYERTIRSA